MITNRTIKKAKEAEDGVASCGCWKIHYIAYLSYRRRSSRGKWELVTGTRKFCEKHGLRFMKRYGLKLEVQPWNCS